MLSLLKSCSWRITDVCCWIFTWLSWMYFSSQLLLKPRNAGLQKVQQKRTLASHLRKRFSSNTVPSMMPIILRFISVKLCATDRRGSLQHSVLQRSPLLFSSLFLAGKSCASRMPLSHVADIPVWKMFVDYWGYFVLMIVAHCPICQSIPFFLVIPFLMCFTLHCNYCHRYWEILYEQFSTCYCTLPYVCICMNRSLIWHVSSFHSVVRIMWGNK